MVLCTGLLTAVENVALALRISGEPPRSASAAAGEALRTVGLEPALQRQGIGSAVMSEILRRLRATAAVLLWASARDSALPFYQRFGFEVVAESAVTGPETGRPHHVIVLTLR